MAFAVQDLRKAYGGVEVLKGVDLLVEDGEIHALLGANGAGKSTLIKCLSGAVMPDSGKITVDGETYSALTPRLSREARVAVVYQDLSLVMSLDVADNVFLGRELRTGPFVNRAKQREITEGLLRQTGINLHPRADLSKVGSAELQAIEIVKAISSDPKVLILDEPTASLSEREARHLGENLKELRKRRLPVLYVTHRLHEVFELADRVTILRGGKVVLSGRVSDLRHDELVQAIVGKEVSTSRPKYKPSSSTDQSFLRVRDLIAPGIGPVTFDVGRGEVLGVFGLVGSGRTELLETLFGVVPKHSGAVELDGRAYAPVSPSDALSRGAALVPADRLRCSMFPSLSATENAMLPTFSKVSRGGIRSRRSEDGVFSRIASRLNLQPRNPHQEAQRFSGGNQQKLVLARWLNEMQRCKLLLFDEPTQGVDVGARREIYDAIAMIGDRSGSAAIVTSSEPDELMQVATRVVVLSNGRIAGVVSGDEINETTLTSLAHRLESRSVAA